MAWTTTKILGTAGVAVAGLVATAVAVKLACFPSVDDKFFQVRNNAALRHAPPGLAIVRPTHFHKPPTNGMTFANVKGAQWMAGRNVTFQTLIATAYSCNAGRVVVPVGAPKENYDFLVTTPDDPREHLQSALRKKLGYTARKESNDVPVLALKVGNPNSDGLKISRDGERENAEVRNGRLYFTHMKLGFLTDGLEQIVKMPVVDKTGLTNFYDFSLVWDAKMAQQIQNGTLDKEAGQKILSGWGLGLEPDTATLEVLVVKRGSWP